MQAARGGAGRRGREGRGLECELERPPDAGAAMPPGPPCAWPPRAALRLWLGCVCFALVQADSPSAPVNVTVRHLKANSAVVSWDVLEDEVKKDVRMLRFIQEVNTTTRSCALWDLEEDTEYIVHVQAISIQGQSPASEPLLFKTPHEVTMKEMGRNQQLRTGEVLIIVVVLFMWAGVIALFCRQYDIIKDNEPNNNKEKTKSASETSTPEHQGGGLLRSKVTPKITCDFGKLCDQDHSSPVGRSWTERQETLTSGNHFSEGEVPHLSTPFFTLK
ncbi:hypothetical protein A6R68_14114 [Neotoma lepida]|uniref:Fibronectin type-III domain-containing protein n=1 Tax=Neotoma lepida TaxID=56216 RepID=A0A1A6HCF8_NEOLE|nr:hypothetical protein A6R68_14114 [Neotoma lepida]